ncbi:MAG: methyl-accepting chemotaxis protein, partial [Nitrospirae bacterium]
ISRILIVLLIGQSFIVTWSYFRQKASVERRLEDVVSLSGRIISKTAATSILSLDFGYLEQLLDDVSKNEEILYLEVLDGEGKRLVFKGEEVLKTGYRVMEIPILSGSEQIGLVRIKYSVSSVRQDTMMQILTTVMLQVVVLIGLVFMIMVFFRRDVGRKIEEISSDIGKITLGDFSVTLNDEDQTELGVIARGVNFLVERLKGSVEKLKGITTNVITAISQLNLTFKNVITGVQNQQKSAGEVSQSVRQATDAQNQILRNTEKLLALSNENVSALLELKATSDEIAAAADNLHKSINEVYSTTTELAQSSREVSMLSSDVSSAVQESSASIEELNASVREIERIAKESAELSAKTTETISEKGMLSIVDTTESMESIEESINGLRDSIEKLGAMSKDIEKILKVVKDITEQTGLLSLNAQILAVQAGEYGKGFSVVADEMKTLSDRTANSTREIASIVKELKKGISGVVEGASATVKMVSRGSEAVTRTGEALREILHASQQSSSIAENIRLATSEQAKGIQLITSAIEHIKLMILEVKRATEEQDKGISYLLESVSNIKESMEITKKSTEEQAKSTSFITENIELSNRMTEEISVASAQQLRVNESILRLLDSVLAVGRDTVRDMKEVSLFIASLQEEVETLKKEMSQFKTKREEPR